MRSSIFCCKISLLLVLGPLPFYSQNGSAKLPNKLSAHFHYHSYTYSLVLENSYLKIKNRGRTRELKVDSCTMAYIDKVLKNVSARKRIFEKRSPAATPSKDTGTLTWNGRTLNVHRWSQFFGYLMNLEIFVNSKLYRAEKKCRKP